MRDSLARQPSLVIRPTPITFGAPAGSATGSPFWFPAADTTTARRLVANRIAEQTLLILAQLFTAAENSKLMLITWRPVADGEADPLADVAGGAEAVRVEHLHRDDLRPGGEAGEGEVVAGARGDRPGDVGAVAVAVERLGRPP